MRRLNKKGAEMTIGTIVVIILALVVLVVLVIGFTGGWGNLWGWLNNLLNPGSTIDAVLSGCTTACSTNSKAAYCDQVRNMKFEAGGNKETAQATCLSLQNSKGLDKDGKLIDIPGAKVEACSSISCSACDNYQCNGVGDAVANCKAGQADITKTAATGKVCCKQDCIKGTE